MSMNGTGSVATTAFRDRSNFNSFIDLAMTFAQLDAGSQWAAWAKSYIHLAEGNITPAQAAARQMGDSLTYHKSVMQACTSTNRAPDFSRIVPENEASVMLEPDAEAWNHLATLMAACGEKGAALRLLKNAIQQNYCGCSALLSDPLLKDLRKEPGFEKILIAASQCQGVPKVQ